MKRLLYFGAAVLCVSFSAEAKLKALIIDGQNNHAVWPKSTIMMKQYLEETELFEVAVARTHYTCNAEREEAFLALAGAGESENLPRAKPDANFSPVFADYDVVISNFGNGAAMWPKATQIAFEQYMKKGGGFVSVHAADNSFGRWEEFNKIIGLGGWGGRNASSGPYVYYTNAGELVHDAEDSGRCGKHGPENNILMTLRVKDHPITCGFPDQWLTEKDECYSLMRGPAEQMTILATGKDNSGRAPTDRHEPMLMVIDYGEGRTFHTTLGHDDYSCEGVDFIVTFTRGVEWAATGAVTQPLPSDFPATGASAHRPFILKK